VESSGGIFGFFKKIFSSEAPSPQIEAKPSGRQTQNRNNRNGERNANRGNRGRGNRNDRGDRNEKTGAQAVESNPANPVNEENRPNRQDQRGRNRNQKPEKSLAVSDSGTQAQVNLTTSGSNSEAGDEPRRGRNRRGRGRGRDRGERVERENENAPILNTYPGFPMGMGGVVASMPLSNLTATLKAKPNFSRQRSNPSQISIVPLAPINLVETSSENQMAPVSFTPTELPKVAFTPLVEEPLKQVIQSAGMVWVGTDSSKLAEVQSQIAAEPPQIQAPRMPKPPANIESGPMVLVETGGQEKTIDKI
jgi:ribonuclease E